MEKLKISRKELLSLLMLTGKVIQQKAIIPILENYRFVAVNGYLSVTGSNMEVFICKRIQIEDFDLNLNVAIPSKIQTIVKALPEQELLLTFDSGKLTLKSSSGKYSLPVEDGSVFPTMPDRELDNFTMSVDALNEGIFRSVFAVAAPGMILSNVLVQLGDGVRFTASNRFILSSKVVDSQQLGKYDMIVPVNVFNAMAGSMKGESVDISYTDKHIIFEFEDGSIFTSILVDGVFVDYQRAFPKNSDKVLKVSRKEFSSAISRALIFSNSNGRVVLDISQDAFSIYAADEDFGQDALENITFEYDGEPIQIGLIGSQVISVLSKQDDEIAYLLMQEKNLPATISDKSVFDPDDVLLAMPTIR